jgi:hypothetical protein
MTLQKRVDRLEAQDAKRDPERLCCIVMGLLPDGTPRPKEEIDAECQRKHAQGCQHVIIFDE